MKKLPFENKISRAQALAGIIYLPFHSLLLPIAVAWLCLRLPESPDLAMQNLIVYAVGAAFLVCVMFSFLRENYYILSERLIHCILVIFMALGLDYILSLPVAYILAAVEGVVANPNNVAVMDLSMGEGYGSMRATAIFLAPIVEELIFRGAIFGGVRNYNRALAYVLSVLMFAVYHIWQYVALYGDASLMIYTIQYFPVSIALAWSYERSGTIWVPIFFHMIINAMSFVLLSMV